MTESGKFEVYKKKLQGICDENELVYRFQKDRYPIMLTIQPTGGLVGQMSMLENDEGDGYRSPEARLVFAYKDGDLIYRTSETFTISEALFNKLKNLFKSMCALWTQYFFRDIMERGILSADKMPAIEDDDEDSGDIVSETFDEVCGEDMESIESFEDNEDSEESDDDGEEDGYEYEERDESGAEAE